MTGDMIQHDTCDCSWMPEARTHSRTLEGIAADLSTQLPGFTQFTVASSRQAPHFSSWPLPTFHWDGCVAGTPCCLAVQLVSSVHAAANNPCTPLGTAMMAKNLLQACWDQAVDIDNPRLVIMLVSEPHIIQLDSEPHHPA